MKIGFTVKLFLLFCMVVSGCGGGVKEEAEGPVDNGKVFLALDFKEGQQLRYKFVSHRDITLKWGAGEAKRSAEGQKGSEELAMVFSYRPVELNPYGVSTIEAKCESVRASRSGSIDGKGKKDAVTYLKGKRFIFKVDSSGKIKDYSGLRELAYEIGRKSFRKSKQMGRIKEPDMTRDFVASQWFLWDSISSIKKPAEGVSVGDSWESEVSVPLPMLKKAGRDVRYRFSRIREGDRGKIAVISSRYSLSDETSRDWPLPYEGSFRMSGTFGFFNKYDLISLSGSGRQEFDIDNGRVVSDRQNYLVALEGGIPGGLLGSMPAPKVTVNQKFTMELLAE